MGQRWLDGYSAHIDMYLLIDGEKHDIAQIGRGTLILRNPAVIPPGTEATLMFKIDGVEEVSHVLLPAGAEKFEEPVPYF